jgi:hypothetical protein
MSTSGAEAGPQGQRAWNSRGLFSRGGNSRGQFFFGARHLYPVNPVTVAKMREAFLSPVAPRMIPTDADLLLDILISHRRHLRVWVPDDVLTRSVQLLTEDRRHLVDERDRVDESVDGHAEDLLSA